MIRRTKKSAPRKSSRLFRPSCETLESRLNLAGAVTAAAFASTLFITGDNAANEVRIVGNGTGTLAVTGVATTLNGVAGGTANFTGILNVFMEMRNGSDTATFVNADIDGMLRFNGSNGDDNLLFGEGNGQTNFFGSVAASMGAGNDTIDVDDDNFTAFLSFTALNGEGNNITDLDPAVSLFLGVTSISGGAGSDFVDLGDALVTTGSIIVNSGNGDNDLFLDGDVTVNGSITVLGGSGPDNFEPGDDFPSPSFRVNGSIVASLGNGVNFTEFDSVANVVTGTISVVGGTGVDTFDFDSVTFDVFAISLMLGAGDNIVLLNEGASIIRSSLTITTLGGADDITGFGLDVRGPVTVNTGEGNDFIEIDNSRFRSVVTVLTAGGNDRVEVEIGDEDDGIGTRFDSVVTIDLGLGDDTLDIGFDADDFVTFNGRVIANGSLGTDTLLRSGFDVFAFAPTLLSFP